MDAVVSEEISDPGSPAKLSAWLARLGIASNVGFHCPGQSFQMDAYRLARTSLAPGPSEAGPREERAQARHRQAVVAEIAARDFDPDYSVLGLSYHLASILPLMLSNTPGILSARDRLHKY
jgi:hypothetical protein